MAKTVVDTGPQKINPTAEFRDNDSNEVVGGYGLVEPVTGKEPNPCCMCKHFDDVNPDKLIKHVLSKGLRPRPDGKFESPIQDDFKSSGQVRANLTMDPKGAGWCRDQSLVVEGLATCEQWSPTKTLSEFQMRMMKRNGR